MKEGGGAEAPWSPQKLPLSLRICRITSRPRKTCLPALVTSPSLPPFCLHALHFGSNKKYLTFISTKNLFLKISQHDEIVQNDTTFCIKKWILIEIKGLYFVFLNFTNSLNCEELLQFCLIYQSNNISSNLQNKVVFVKSLYLWYIVCFRKYWRTIFLKIETKN